MRILFWFNLLALAAVPCAAQSVSLVWTDVKNPAGTTTWNVYRAPNFCPSAGVFMERKRGLTLTQYVDTPVLYGNYCYAVTATVNTADSDYSNKLSISVPPSPPTNLSGTVIMASAPTITATIELAQIEISCDNFVLDPRLVNTQCLGTIPIQQPQFPFGNVWLSVGMGVALTGQAAWD